MKFWPIPNTVKKFILLKRTCDNVFSCIYWDYYRLRIVEGKILSHTCRSIINIFKCREICSNMVYSLLTGKKKKWQKRIFAYREFVHENCPEETLFFQKNVAV